MYRKADELRLVKLQRQGMQIATAGCNVAIVGHRQLA